MPNFTAILLTALLAGSPAVHTNISLLLSVCSALLLKQGYVDPFTVLIAPIVAMLVGFLPVLLFGVPAYATLLYKGWANYFTVVILGTVPAALLLPFEHGAFSLFFCIYGLPIALTSHLFTRVQLRSN